MKNTLLFVCILVCACLALADGVSVAPKGEGTQKEPYQITQMGNFVWLAHQSDKVDAGTTIYCVQINDIDAAETEEWQSFPDIETNNINGENKGAWTLNYDGQGFNIEDLCISQTKGFYSALFCLGSFQLKNINIKGVKSKVSWGSTGVLVGNMGAGYIDNCHISGTSIHATAGLVQEVIVPQGESIEISNCSVETDLTNGWAGVIEQVRNYGTLVIRNTSYKGKITIGDEYGGDVISAGFIKALQLEEKHAEVLIEDCYSAAEIKCANSDLGLSGFVGIINNANYGEPVDIEINRCYSTGSISNTRPWGSASFLTVIYGCEPVVKDCYYNSTTLKKADKYALPKTEEEMKQLATFEHWDFENVWDIDEGETMPYLVYTLPEPCGVVALLLLTLLLTRRK
ncbi:hypothetical protein IJS98_04535 [bacterium]|nr:hypothetical protein [bacterium]